MKKIEIEVTEIYNLNNLFKSKASEKIVEEYFLKKNNKYTQNKFKPGSEKYIQEEERLESIRNLPDYGVKEVGTLIIENDSFERVEFTIMEYDTQAYDWEGNPYTRTCTFLTDNSYWGYNIMYSLEDVLKQSKVEDILFKQLKSTQRNKLYNNLLAVGQEFTILIDRAVKARAEFTEIIYYSNYRDYGRAVVMGEEVFGEEEMGRIYNSYKNDEKFYDSNDKLVTFYSCDCYIDYYRKYNNKEDLAETNQ